LFFCAYHLGLALPVSELVTCKATPPATISCPNDYVIVLLSSEYATNDIDSAGCQFSPIDCFETTTSLNLGCSGKQSCSVSYFSRTLSTCNRKTSKYLYVTYQCVPSKHLNDTVFLLFFFRCNSIFEII
jgi:hypothetical protein